MKILITHELYPPDFVGGGEKLVYEMAMNLKKAGHEVRVITTGNPSIRSYEGISTTRLRIPRYAMNFAFLPILKQARWADIIQTATYNAAFPSWLAGKIAKKPVLCLVMSYWGEQWKKLRPGLSGVVSKFVEKKIVKRSFAKTIFLSNFSRDSSRQQGLKHINEKNSSVINPGIDTQKFIPLKKDNFVLFSGRLEKQKGVYDLMEVARRLPTIKFVIMGSGEEEEKMRRLATANVEFIGFKRKDDQKLYETFGKAAVFFLPSYGETFGFVIAEAMASGCSIVSTIPFGFAGKVVVKERIDDMVKAIKELMDNTEKITLHGQENRTLAASFSWDSFTEKLIEEYNDVLKYHNL